MKLKPRTWCLLALPILCISMAATQTNPSTDKTVHHVNQFFQDIFADLRLTSDSEVDVVSADGVVTKKRIGALFGMTRVVTAFNYHPGLNPNSFADSVPIMNEYRDRLDRLQEEAKSSGLTIAVSSMGCGGQKLDRNTINQRWANRIGEQSQRIPEAFYRVGTFERIPTNTDAKLKRHRDLYRLILSPYFDKGKTEYTTDIEKVRYYVSGVKLSDQKCVSCHAGSKKNDVVALMVYCAQKAGN